ncbi:MAG: MmgE/PrpD family protein [Nitrososphaerota archaeon]
MGETIAEEIAEYVSAARLSDFAPESIQAAKERIWDTLGVMFAAADAPPVMAARRVIERWPVSGGATVLGSRVKVAPHDAALVNGIMARYLDFNDTYLSKEAIHPSDMIPGIIAAGECFEASGEDLLRSVLVAYEVACAMADTVTIRDRGFDHVSNIAIGAAAGVASLLELDLERTHEAINIATVNAAALRQTRSGELSMWKGCAAAYAARHGLYSSLLAAEGVTGPKPVFEGELGYMKAVSGPFTMPKLTSNAVRILRTSIKWRPVEYHSMSAVEAATRIYEEAGGIRASEVDKIAIRTFRVSYNILAKDPEKWRPKSRETADHSLPYITIRTLLDGDIWLESFNHGKIHDLAFLELAEKTTVEVEPRYDSMYPGAVPNMVEVSMRDGRRYYAEVVYPKGHFRNPLTDEELRAKFTRLIRGRLTEEQTATVWEVVMVLERLKSVKDLTSLLSYV